MNVHFPAQRRWASRLAHLAVVIVVLALAAATFVLSYTGVHSIALQAGVPTRLARIYPGVFDAALVIACAAALMLREGRWWARAYAWLSIIVVIAVVGAADVVHAMNVALPHRKTAGVIAAAPWVLVLLSFSLWLTMLRQSRTQSASQPPQPTALQPTAVTAPQPAVPDFPQPEATIPEEAIAPEETIALPETAAESEATDEPGALPHDYWDANDEGEPDDEGEPGDQPATAPPAIRGHLVTAASDDEQEPPLPFATVPRLRRVRSTPTPPEDEDEDQ